MDVRRSASRGGLEPAGTGLQRLVRAALFKSPLPALREVELVARNQTWWEGRQYLYPRNWQMLRVVKAFVPEEPVVRASLCNWLFIFTVFKRCELTIVRFSSPALRAKL